MGTALYILISYLIAVAIYTVVVKNDAMHKHNPHVNYREIIKMGLRDMGIGFLIAGVIIATVIGGIILYNNYIY